MGGTVASYDCGACSTHDAKASPGIAPIDPRYLNEAGAGAAGLSRRQVGKFARGSLARPGYRPKGKRASQLFLLQGLPGVGSERAARLLDRFGSVQAVAWALPSDLTAINGIGENVAGKIRWALEGSAESFPEKRNP